MLTPERQNEASENRGPTRIVNSEKWGGPHFLGLILVVGVLFLVVSYFIAMFLGVTLFFFTSKGLVASRLHIQLFPVMLFAAIIFYVPVSINVGLLFSVLWVIFLLCFFAAWRFRESLAKTVRNVIYHSPADAFKNSLFAMPIISSIVLILALAITVLEASGGIPTGTPPLPKDPFQDLLLLSLSPVIEEIGFRLTPIGTFLAVYLFFFREAGKTPSSRTERLKTSFLAFLLPDKAKKMAGARNVSDSGVLRGITRVEWLIVVLTSLSFGLAHVLGGGWDIGKVASASVQGFALGLTYLLYGIQAPILLHWFFNYYSYTYILSADVYPALSPLITLFDTVTFLFGVIGLLALATVLINNIKKSRTERTTPVNPQV